MTEQKTYYSSVLITEELIKTLDEDKDYYFISWNGLPRLGKPIVLKQNEHLTHILIETPLLTTKTFTEDDLRTAIILATQKCEIIDGRIKFNLKNSEEIINDITPSPSLPHTGETANRSRDINEILKEYKTIQHDDELDYISLPDAANAITKYASQPSPVLLLPPSDEEIEKLKEQLEIESNYGDMLVKELDRFKSMLSDDQIDAMFPCEAGQSVIMIDGYSYDQIRQFNYSKRQGVKEMREKWLSSYKPREGER